MFFNCHFIFKCIYRISNATNSLKITWETIQTVEKKRDSKHSERVESSILMPKEREESQCVQRVLQTCSMYN